MNTANQKRVLISGASFAGLSTAYWMNKLGYQVTIVEIAESLKKGGTPVNILGDTIDIVKHMGLFEQIVSNKLVMQSFEFKNADDITERRDFTQESQAERGEVEYEIERDVLLLMMYELVKDKVEFIYGESITSLSESLDQLNVTFKKGTPRAFDLVLAATAFILLSESCGLDRKPNSPVFFKPISRSPL